MTDVRSPRMTSDRPLHPLGLLIVEDNPLDQRAVARAAKQVSTPLEVTVAGDGREAISHLESDARVDLMLLDLNLPLMSGLDVLAFMRASEQLRRIPTVIVTTSADHADVSRAYDLGANAYLTKPDDLAGWNDLLARIESFWLSVVLFPPRRPDST